MAFVSDQFSYQTDLPRHPDEWIDFDSFLDFPSGLVDDQLASVDSISPAALSTPYEADATLDHSPAELMQSFLQEVPSHSFSQEDFLADPCADAGFIEDTMPLFDDHTYDGHVYSYDSASAFRHLVEMQVAADPRVASIKEKRREASIALHLQRLCDATAIDLEMSSDSSTNFSSPCWSEFMRDSVSPQPTKISGENSPTPASAHGVGGVELVLDLNMNATTNLPRKQKPRSQSQKENYIKARKYGACEKHKKQHKRCNCLEKASARAGVNESPTDAAFKERPRQPTLQVLGTPTARRAASSGHDPSSSSPSVPPSTRATKGSPSSSPGHDPSCSPSPGVLYTKTKARVTSSSPGHDPSHRPPLAIQFGKTTNSGTTSHTGHDPISSSLAASRSTNAARDTTGKALYRAFGVPNTSVIMQSPESSKQSSSSANGPVAGARRTPSLEIWRPKQPTILATQFYLGPTVALNQSIHERVTGSLGLRRTQVRVNCSGRLPVPENSCSQTLSQSPKQLSAATLSSKEQVPGISWRGRNIVRLPWMFKQFGGLLWGTVSPIARAWHSLTLSAAWTEMVVYKCLSLSGGLLMNARKSLHLSHWRTL